uniref:Uncharacterized protein n=1 Tax=Chlorella vulgaris TaxID=3077 RepID=V9H152_CHLVU|nr:hypothetical protein ChvulCp085 [Chlorella vulgaris]pir/T07272/ hypothetical protein 60a - Chlorella vulgaris chloroplast [Chlorella vulgaris]BAA57920.1 unnamed protein product [Chlorella vulgaris]
MKNFFSRKKFYRTLLFFHQKKDQKDLLLNRRGPTKKIYDIFLLYLPSTLIILKLTNKNNW